MNADDTFFVFDVIMYTKKYCLNTILYTWKQNKKCMKCHIHGFADKNVFLAIFFQSTIPISKCNPKQNLSIFILMVNVSYEYEFSKSYSYLNTQLSQT